MLSHMVIASNNLKQAHEFYSAVLRHINIVHYHGDPMCDALICFHNPIEAPDTETGRKQSFWLCVPVDSEKARAGNGVNVGLSAPSRASVDATYATATELGARCEGSPGLRPEYHADWYCCYLRDLDDNKLRIVCQKPEL
jgi:predicted lactoylglutathione lyase